MNTPDLLIAAELERLEDEYAIKPDAVFRAILFCGMCKVPLPDWAYRAVKHSWAAYSDAEVETLGEAFRTERPQNWRKDAEHKRIALAFKAYQEISKRPKPLTVDKAQELFAKKHHISKELVRNYYYEVKKVLKNTKI